MAQGELPVIVTDSYQWGTLKEKFSELFSLFTSELRKAQTPIWKMYAAVVASTLVIFLLGVGTGWMLFHSKAAPANVAISDQSEKPISVPASDEPIKLVMIQNHTSNCKVVMEETDAKGKFLRGHGELAADGVSHGIGVNPGMPQIILKVRVVDANGVLMYESALHTFKFDPINRDKKEKYVWSVGDTDPPDAVKKEI